MIRVSNFQRQGYFNRGQRLAEALAVPFVSSPKPDEWWLDIQCGSGGVQLHYGEDLHFGRRQLLADAAASLVILTILLGLYAGFTFAIRNGLELLWAVWKLS